MPSRQPHRKSRHGCRKCKERKVRCGLEKPICRNCDRLGHDCSFVDSDPLAAALPRDSRSTSHSIVGDNTPVATADAGNLPVRELELIHHYATTTCFSATDKPAHYTIWQVNIPKHALKHPFLMRGLLALAALHIHHELPQTSEKRQMYANSASFHQDMALGDYTQQLFNINQTNSEALFAYSAVLASTSFAFLTHTAHELSGNEFISKMLEIFDLLNGAKAVAIEGQRWIKQGDLAPLAIRPDTEHLAASQLGRDASAALDSLLVQVNNNTSPETFAATPNKEGTQDTGAIYTSAIDGVKKLFLCATNDRPDLSMVIGWPVLIHPQYHVLLKQGDQMALSILAQFGAALHCLNEIWWAQGLGAQLVKAVSQVIDADWLPYISWPLSWTSINHRYYSPGLGGMQA